MKPLPLPEKITFCHEKSVTRIQLELQELQERSRAGEDLWFHTVEIDPVAIFGNNVKCWEWDT